MCAQDYHTLASSSPVCHRVPPELLRQIFMLLAQDQKTLHQCVLTCRQWCRVAIPIMWRYPQFSRLVDVERLAATLVASSPPSAADSLHQQQEQCATPRFPYTKLVESLCFSTLPEQDRNNPYLAKLVDTIVNCLVVVVATTPPPPKASLLQTSHCSSSPYFSVSDQTSGAVARKARKCPMSSGAIKRSRSVLFRNGVDAGMRPYSSTDLPLDPPDSAVGAENDGFYPGSIKPSVASSDVNLPRSPYSLHSSELALPSATLSSVLITSSSAATVTTTTSEHWSRHGGKQKQAATTPDTDNSSTHNYVGPTALAANTTYASSLRQLDLRFCKGVRNYSLQRLAPRLSTLSLLNLAGGQRADITIAKLSQHMFNLRRVSLAWTSNLTDFGVSELVQRCKGIQALDLTHCMQIEDTSMFAIAHHLKDLSALSVAYCASVSDTGVCEVAARCRSIRILNVTKCFRVSQRTRMDMEKNKILTSCDPFAPFSIDEDPPVEGRQSVNLLS